MQTNLYLKECGLNTYQIVMAAPPENTKTGIAIQWPVNPEMTGETGIIVILYNTGHFKGKKFNHSKLGIITGIRAGVYPLIQQ